MTYSFVPISVIHGNLEKNTLVAYPGAIPSASR